MPARAGRAACDRLRGRGRQGARGSATRGTAVNYWAGSYPVVDNPVVDDPVVDDPVVDDREEAHVALQYATPHAFRAALRDRFGAYAHDDHGMRVEELQRQFAYDRVLARCFAGQDRDRWVLKGAIALLARLDGRARHSKDIDLHYALPSAGPSKDPSAGSSAGTGR